MCEYCVNSHHHVDGTLPAVNIMRAHEEFVVQRSVHTDRDSMQVLRCTFGRAIGWFSPFGAFVPAVCKYVVVGWRRDDALNLS